MNSEMYPIIKYCNRLRKNSQKNGFAEIAAPGMFEPLHRFLCFDNQRFAILSAHPVH